MRSDLSVGDLIAKERHQIACRMNHARNARLTEARFSDE